MNAIEDEPTSMRSPSSFLVWKAFEIGRDPLSEVIQRIVKVSETSRLVCEQLRSHFNLEERPWRSSPARLASRTLEELGLRGSSITLKQIMEAAYEHGMYANSALAALTLRAVYDTQPSGERLFLPLQTSTSQVGSVLFLACEGGERIIRFIGRERFSEKERFVFKLPLKT